jgi:AraC-like DNA-binding protein
VLLISFPSITVFLCHPGPIVFSTSDHQFLFFVRVLENLRLASQYDGFIFLAQAALNPPILKPHFHVELELNLVVQGSVSYVIAGQRQTFHQGSLLWIFPEQVHQLVDRTADAMYYVAVFKPALIRRTCHQGRYEELKQKNTAGGGVFSRTLPSEAFFHLRATMASLTEDAPDAALLNREAGFGLSPEFRFGHDDPDLLNAGLSYLLVQCWRACRHGTALPAAVGLHPAIEKALMCLNDDPTDDLRAVASRCGVSTAYLSRLFHKQVGTPLNRYRNSVRLARFMNLYRPGKEMKMLAAAYDAGFGSYARFFKVFSETYGHGPREFLECRTSGASVDRTGGESTSAALQG